MTKAKRKALTLLGTLMLGILVLPAGTLPNQLKGVAQACIYVTGVEVPVVETNQSCVNGYQAILEDIFGWIKGLFGSIEEWLE